MYKVYSDELMHYGVKGMKWGVRKEIDREIQSFKNITNYGWRTGHGKNVYGRMQDIKKNESRMQGMNKRQKRSYEKAEKYWKNRSEGKGIYGSGNRILVKRIWDSTSSYSPIVSIGRNVVGNLISQGVTNASQKAMGIPTSGLQPVSVVVNTAAYEIGSRICDRILGHF